MQIDLSDDERDALCRQLRDHIAETRYPLAPALRPLKAILAKLQPQLKTEPLPQPKATVPSSVMQKKRRR